MLGFLANVLARAVPYIPRIVNFVKSGLQYGVPALLKGAARIKEFTAKALPWIGAIQAGIETSKSLPWIGEKVKEIAERPQVKDIFTGAENILKTGGHYAGVVESELPKMVERYAMPLF